MSIKNITTQLIDKIIKEFKKQDNEYKLWVWDQVKIFLREKDFDLLTAKNNKQNKT